jgi:dipeptidyl aminopeptidase/acylaminoacyl peptidase
VQVNERTGKRDIYRVSDKGGAAEALTSDGSDNTDPNWNFSGGRIVFASDRGKEAEDGRNNFDIWMLDIAAGKPVQITQNGSVDDMPSFDPAGDCIYFRSNRGGAWGIWRIKLK